MNSKEYKEFMDMLENNEVYEKDVYQEILTKEKEYLDKINNIFQEKNKAKDDLKSFLSVSVTEHYFKFINVLNMIFKETITMPSIKEIPWIFLYGERKIYVGIMLVIISLFLFFVTISS